MSAETPSVDKSNLLVDLPSGDKFCLELVWYTDITNWDDDLLIHT